MRGNKIKTKIRRLYDIANVFSSLGLIKKTQLMNKKPAFEWIGLSGLDKFITTLVASLNKSKAPQPDNTPMKARARDAFRSNKSAFKTPKQEKTKSIFNST